jgi:membrane protease YdiL (CAAX protease family)
MTKTTLSFVIGLVTIFVIWASLSSKVSFDILNPQNLLQDLGLGLAGTILIFYWMFLAEAGLYKVYTSLEGGSDNKFIVNQARRGTDARKTISESFKTTSLLVELLGSLLYCFAEELFFRAAVQGELGLLVGVIVFVLFHDITNVSWSIQLVGMGLVCGFLYMHTGSLVAPTVAHFGVNILSLQRMKLIKPVTDS